MDKQVIYGLENLPDRPRGCVVAIGNFDGVHRGHQRIVAMARKLTEGTHRLVVAMTFDPPPLKLLAPARAPAPLMQIEQKCQALLSAGADMVVVVRTTQELLHTDADDFVRGVLVDKLSPSHIVEGENFLFGRDRRGDVGTLRRLGTVYGFQVHVAEVVTAELSDGQRVAVSSSLIRQLLREGRVQDAALCLGRPYTMDGQIVHGHAVGRTMEFPTANLNAGDQLVPADGVYAGWAQLPDRTWPAAISVGVRPTFEDTVTTIEAFLIGMNGDLYGQRMALQFTHRLRDQKKFSSADELRQQMDRDVQFVKDRLQ